MSEPSVIDSHQPVRYDEEEKYLLRNERDITHVLQSLIDRRSLISAYVSPRNLSFPTALLRYSPEDRSVLLDGSINPALNNAVESANHLTCVSQLEKIHIQFRLSRCVRQQVDGAIAFRAAAPDQLLQLQRREFYRLQVPVSQPIVCRISVPQGEDREPLTLELRVLDISGGGIAVVAPPEHAGFTPMREFEHCTLHLPGSAPMHLRLMVKSLFRQVLPNGLESWRAGCQFTRLPRGADAIIQRYIFRMERLRTARKHGLG